MSRAAVELDFFGLEPKPSPNASSKSSQFQKFLHRRRSFRDIQGSISKIDPEVLKTVIASGSASCSSESSGNENLAVKQSVSVPASPSGDRIRVPPLPVYSPAPRPAVSELAGGTAPLTIFYNGVVTVYDVPRDKAESILKLAVEGRGRAVESADAKVSEQKQLLETLNSGDLPIFRKKSLQRFLEKRKERVSGNPTAAPRRWPPLLRRSSSTPAALSLSASKWNPKPRRAPPFPSRSDVQLRREKRGATIVEHRRFVVATDLNRNEERGV